MLGSRNRALLPNWDYELALIHSTSTSKTTPGQSDLRHAAKHNTHHTRPLPALASC